MRQESQENRKEAAGDRFGGSPPRSHSSAVSARFDPSSSLRPRKARLQWLAGHAGPKEAPAQGPRSVSTAVAGPGVRGRALRPRPPSRRSQPPDRAFRALRLALALAASIGASACSEQPAAPASSAQPLLLVIGVDGLEWDVVLPLVRSGRAPHLARLMERGTWGALETATPTFSPVLWTTIATGKRPVVHGIEGFTRRTHAAEGSQARERLVRSEDRRCAALWTIASACGKRAALLGWWASYPAEPIDGVLVSQRSGFGAELAKGGPFGSLTGQVHPPEREAWVASVRDAVVDEERDHAPGLAPWAAPMQLDARAARTLPPLERRLLEPCRTSMRADEIYARLALDLLHDDEEAFDVLAVYLGSPDVVGHRFWRYHEPQRFREPIGAEALANCASLVSDNVAWIDAWVGRLVAAAGPDVNVVVLSDHGMRAVRTEAAFQAEAPLAELNSGHHLDAPPAVWIAAGPTVRSSDQDLAASPQHLLGLLDVLPTWLSWLDLPIGRDMPGRVAEATVALDHLRTCPPRRIESYEAFVPLPAPSAPDAPGAPSSADADAERAGRARLDELRGLGYLGASGGEEDDGE